MQDLEDALDQHKQSVKKWRPEVGGCQQRENDDQPIHPLGDQCRLLWTGWVWVFGVVADAVLVAGDDIDVDVALKRKDVHGCFGCSN